MARHRSRQAETEDVNQRRLKRGAVNRQHIARWAVGYTELAPGIVGDVHLHPTTLETIREVSSGAGVGQLLVVAATGQSFASGGAYVTADEIVYQHGFDEVEAAGDSIVWPVDAVGEIQVEFVWDTYTAGGTIEIEVDGEVPAWGLIATGPVGSEGCKRRGVHIAEGAVVKVKVTQTSGSAKTGDVHVEFSVPDPTLNTPAPPVPPVPPGPASLSPKVWYRGEALVASLTDGDPVATWADISGNGFDATQATAGSRPTFRAGALNGRSVVEFDGTDDYLFHAFDHLPTAPDQAWHCFVVFVTNDASQPQYIFNGDDQTNVPGDDRGSQYLLVHTTLKTNPHVQGQVESGEAVTDDVWHLGESWESATQVRCLLDGVGDAPSSYTPVLLESPNGMYVGSHPANPADSMNGRIAEIIGWDRVLTTTERDLVRDYLNTEYGV